MVVPCEASEHEAYDVMSSQKETANATLCSPFLGYSQMCAQTHNTHTTNIPGVVTIFSRDDDKRKHSGPSLKALSYPNTPLGKASRGRCLTTFSDV